MKKLTLRIKFLLAIVTLLAVSCSTPREQLIYMNGIQTDQTYDNVPLPEEYRIRPNDQLFIQVISDDPLNAAFLNLTNTQMSSSAGSSSGSMELITYLVDEAGQIEYPQLGKLEVEGHTTTEVGALLQKEVDRYLEGASVFVKLVNRTLTVLGEVKAPGQVLMVKNQLSIFEALGAAGDITDYGDRKTVKLIRELPEGKHIVELDMTDPDLINSPYYYILPHDVLYVEHRTKVYGAKNMPYGTPIAITTSIISTLALILTLVK